MKTIIQVTVIYLSFLVIFLDNLHATTYETTSNGNWNSSSIWSPSKPSFPWGSTDTVIVKHSINLNTNINIHGVFIVNSGAALTTTSKNITVGQASTFTNNGSISVKNFYADWGNTTIVNQSNITTTKNMILKEGSFTNNGTITVGKNFTNDYDSEFQNSASGSLIISQDFLNRDSLHNAGIITVNDDFKNDWGYTIVNSGTINATDDINNYGDFINSGTLSAGGDFLNNWGCDFTNSGSVTVTEDFTNKGDVSNTNSITVSDDFNNYYGTTVSNYGLITVADDVSNSGDIQNNGSLTIDGSYAGSGDVSGSGSLCNSDGLTDPTGGAKGVTCPICGGDGGGLPVEFVEFDAQQIQNSIQLHWITVSETNNDHFNIEKSTNGIDFTYIGSVTGNGNSNQIQSYKFTDNQPSKGTIYYRLVQIDFDGSIEYSKIIEVNIIAKMQLSLYPNPSIYGDPIHINFGTEDKKYIEIYDLSGRLIMNFSTNEQSYTLQSQAIPKGLFLMKISTDDQVLVRKFQVR